LRPYWKDYLKLALVSFPIALHAASSTTERIAFRRVNKVMDTPYYITPSEPVGQEAFAIIREAMHGKGMVALGRLVLSRRERVIALEAYDKGLLGTTLRYPYEVRKAADYFCDLPDLTIAPDLLTLARHIVDTKAADFDPTSFRDRYEGALLAHLKAKQSGTVQERKPTFATPHRVINLMEALRRGVAEDEKRAAPRTAATPARKRA
jgi:DNA end-binding protein Ku